MTPEEAAATLASIPELARVSAAQLSPDAVIVCELDRHLSRDTIAQLRVSLESVWPERKVVVCEAGMRPKVIDPGV